MANKSLSNDEIVDELYKRMRVVVSTDDPVLIVAELSKIIIEQQSDIIASRLSNVATGFERSAQKNADSYIESMNKSLGILQGYLITLEAMQQQKPVALLLDEKHPKSDYENREDSFKERFIQVSLYAGVFAIGSVFAFLVSGFMWVFFR